MDTLRFKNYRCFTDTGEVTLKPLTFLLGANSSGKSSFLEFFPLLKQSVGVRRNGIFLWYAGDVDFKDFENAVKTGEESMEISWKYNNFAINDRRSNNRLKDLPIDQEAFSENIGLKLTMQITASRDNSDKLRLLKIEFFDEVVILEIDEDQHIIAIINGRRFDGELYRMRTTDSNFLLPRILYSFESDGAIYSSSYPRFLEHEEVFQHAKKKDLIEFFLSEPFSYLKKDDYRFLFESMTDKDKVDVAFLRDVYLLAHIDDIIESINFRIQAETSHLSYVKPLRVMPERYYRYQNYSVDDIDSDGKNLVMFLANLSEYEMKRFQNWTFENFKFKIFVSKHEGHVELTIGDTKKNARNLVDVGFGYTQLLPIITIVWKSLRSKGGRYYYPGVNNPCRLIAIEQPELHLHPRIQAAFAEVLAKVIMTLPPSNDLRFIIETHSETIINKIGAMVQTEELSSDKVNVVIFNGVNEGLDDYIVEGEFDSDGFLNNWPLGFFL